MHVYVIKRQHDGKIESVNRTPEGAGMVLYGYGDGRFADNSPFTMETIHKKLEQSPSLEVEYSNGDTLVLEHHAIAS